MLQYLYILINKEFKFKNKSQIPNELLEKLTLSKENILKVLYNCRVTESTKHPMKFSFYSPTSSRKAPEMNFD